MITPLELKQKALEYKQKTGIRSSHAHEIIARSLGYNSHIHFLTESRKYHGIPQKVTKIKI